MDIISIFFTMKVCCVFSLESPHRGDSNEYTQHTIFNVKKKIIKKILNYPKSAALGFCSKGPKNELETVVVNEPSVFEPLKFYCIALCFSFHFFYFYRSYNARVRLALGVSPFKSSFFHRDRVCRLLGWTFHLKTLVSCSK